MELSIAILVIIGVLLMILETFVPGWIAGILGGLSVLGAVFLVLTAEEFATWPAWGRTVVACGIVAVTVAAMLLWMKLFGVRLWNKAFTLQASIPSQSASQGIAQGTEGVAVTDLRPLGRAEFGTDRHDVRCEDGFASAGSRIRVTGTEPGNLLVRLV
jgi:membrane-bound ClpP family serine protease